MSQNRICFMIDLDGTIYHRSNPLPYAKELIQYLNDQKNPFIFFTNSPERNHQQLAHKLQAMGLDVATHHFLSTADLTIGYLQEHSHKSPRDTLLYVIGNDSFQETLRMAGYTLLQHTQPVADYVVVGFDDALTFETCTTAFQQLSQGAVLLSTNQDTTIPTETGMIPHTGPIVAFLEFAAQTKAINLGKPDAIALEAVLSHFKCQKNQLRLIGDNLETDILLGENFDICSYLVYTGLTSREMVQSRGLADCVVDFDHLGSLIDYLKVEADNVSPRPHSDSD